MDVCTVSLRLRVYLSVLALYGAANALYWKSSERQNSTHLTLLKHQNTKTSLYKLSKNHWVIALFEFFGSVRKKLQLTVSLKHPVLQNFEMRERTENKEMKMKYGNERNFKNIKEK